MHTEMKIHFPCNLLAPAPKGVYLATVLYRPYMVETFVLSIITAVHFKIANTYRHAYRIDKPTSFVAGYPQLIRYYRVENLAVVSLPCYI